MSERPDIEAIRARREAYRTLATDDSAITASAWVYVQQYWDDTNTLLAYVAELEEIGRRAMTPQSWHYDGGLTTVCPGCLAEHNEPHKGGCWAEQFRALLGE